MHIDSFVEEMERLAPSSLAEEFDHEKIGIVVEGRPEINTVCCALDATPDVIREAVNAGADMLVVHHTPLWTPVTTLTGRTAVLMRMLLSAQLNLYVMHTNFDHATSGVNDALCELLGLTDIESMTLGNIGTCTITTAEISRRIRCPLRIWGDLKKYERLAVVGGSGFDHELMAEATAHGAQAFLSAEMKHSVARAAPIPCLEATHYALEAPAMQRLAARMRWHYIDDAPEISFIP
jgi:dinuclear metal center YbgI/SA1388 family protein